MKLVVLWVMIVHPAIESRWVPVDTFDSASECKAELQRRESRPSSIVNAARFYVCLPTGVAP